MYKVEWRDEHNNILARSFNTYEQAEECYDELQAEFTYIEIQLLSPEGERLSHCFLIGCGKDPIWGRNY